MAKRPHRYTEARMYLVGGSIGLLLIVWSALAMKDIARSATTGAQTPAATSEPAVGSSNSSSGGSSAEPRATGRPNATAAPRPTPKPQTRSRGS